MRLSDIVSAASGLAIYAEIAMVLFLAAFVTVLGQVFAKQRAAEWSRAASLALDDDDDGAAPIDGVHGRTATDQTIAVTHSEGSVRRA
jgi:hypothetical protein